MTQKSSKRQSKNTLQQQNNLRVIGPHSLKFYKNVQVANDQVKAQSKKKIPTPKTEVGKN